jgi:restriction endonuclease S subunit
MLSRITPRSNVPRTAELRQVTEQSAANARRLASIIAQKHSAREKLLSDNEDNVESSDEITEQTEQPE